MADPVVNVEWSRDEETGYEVATVLVNGEVATTVAFTHEALLSLGEKVVRDMVAE
jgi:hypothetical protein